MTFTAQLCLQSLGRRSPASDISGLSFLPYLHTSPPNTPPANSPSLTCMALAVLLASSSTSLIPSRPLSLYRGTAVLNLGLRLLSS